MYQLRHYKVESLKEIYNLKDKGLCDGILAFDVDDQKTVKVLESTRIPFICSHHTEKLTGCNTCSTDNYKGGFFAASHLFAAGFKKPAYVTGYKKETFSHNQRLQGFLDGSRGIDVKIFDTNVSIKGGYKSGCSMIDSIRNGEIDSIGVVNDLTAIGVISALTENRIKIPGDVSIIGYDNLPFTIALPFTLSTIELSLGKIYSRAVELLIKSIKTKEIYNETIEPVLVPGGSVKRKVM